MGFQICAADAVADMEEDLKVLMKADPDRQESLQTEVIPDPMEGEQTLSGMTVVITGSLNHFARREDLQAEIEKRGGKASGSVSKNTSVLVNNDIASASSKNKKAKELGVPIMTEEEFMEKYFG